MPPGPAPADPARDGDAAREPRDRSLDQEPRIVGCQATWTPAAGFARQHREPPSITRGGRAGRRSSAAVRSTPPRRHRPHARMVPGTRRGTADRPSVRTVRGRRTCLSDEAEVGSHPGFPGPVAGFPVPGHGLLEVAGGPLVPILPEVDDGEAGVLAGLDRQQPSEVEQPQVTAVRSERACTTAASCPPGSAK